MNELKIKRQIKEENIEIEEHNLNTDKFIMNKVNKKIKLEEEAVEKNIEVQPTWIVKVDEIKQEKNDTWTEKHMSKREKDIFNNEGSAYEESKNEMDEDFDDETLAEEEMIDISQISVNEKTYDEYTNNYDVLTKENPFSCQKCPQQCTTKEELQKHMLLHENKESDYLKEHFEIHRKMYSCKVCQKDFSYQSNMKMHMRTHTGEKPFECTICSKRFTAKNNATKHMLIHTNEKPFSCQICKKRFRLKWTLRMHMHVHENPECRSKKYICGVCTRGFNQQGSLQRHMRMHTGEKPFECTICSQRFREKSNLKQHTMVIHTNENLFSCHICNKQFRYKHVLSTHIQQHENPGYKPKKYTCSVCKRHFYQQGNLQRHMRMHTEEKPFECTICSQRFTTKYGVKAHMVVHTNEKPFSCHICNEQFRYKNYLRKHVRRWHEDPNCSTATSTDSTAVTKDTSQNLELDVMESQYGNKDIIHIVNTNMQKHREIYVGKNANAAELIVGVPLNETDEDVEDEPVVRTLEKIKEETDPDMVETAKIVNEYNKPLKIKEEKKETEQNEFEKVFICC